MKKINKTAIIIAIIVILITSIVAVKTAESKKKAQNETKSVITEAENNNLEKIIE